MLDIKKDDKYKTLPKTSGVYIFKNASSDILYVGKAVNLQKRVSQYFLTDDAVGAKTKVLVPQIATIETITTVNEFDALLLEAKLIYEHQPKYNILAKDDKSPLYIAITMHEPLPHILTIRKQLLATLPNTTRIFGPFGSSQIIKDILGSIRAVVPYCTQAKRNGKPCFYTQIGSCNPCPSVITKIPDGEEKKIQSRIYRSHIKRVIDILSGNTATVRADLEKSMRRLAAENKFEQAAEHRNQIQSLDALMQKRFDPAVYLESTILTDLRSEQEDLLNALKPYYTSLATLHRIECMDISNISGTDATGSMVVIQEGRTVPGEYRKFTIRYTSGPNDFAMMAEILERRLHHKEWPYPNLLVIDGGKGQVRAAKNVLQKCNISIPLIGLAKRFEEIIVPHGDSFVTLRLSLSSGAIHLLTRIRDEAHRFALSHHRRIRSKHTIPSPKYSRTM